MPRLFVVGGPVAEDEGEEEEEEEGKLGSGGEEAGGEDGLELDVADWRMRAHALPEGGDGVEGESGKGLFPAEGEASSSSSKNGDEEEGESLGGLYSESKVRGWRSTFSSEKVSRLEGSEEEGEERWERVRDCICASLRIPVLDDESEYGYCEYCEEGEVGELSSWT